MTNKYDLNIDLFMACATINNHYRWHGLIGHKKLLKTFETKMNESIYAVLEYGIDLITDGRNPQIVEFYLSEAIEKEHDDKKLDYMIMKDLRLVKQFVHWMQAGDNHSCSELLNCFTDSFLRSQYKDWLYLNQFDNKITFEQTCEMNPIVRESLMDSSPMIKQYSTL